MEVQDNGSGMDKEFIKERLFRPFDSTKGKSGMGIGVYETRDYIHKLGGDLEGLAPGHVREVERDLGFAALQDDDVGARLVAQVLHDAVVGGAAGVDLLVIGRDGSPGGAPKTLVGSTTDAVIRKVTKSTIVVPSGAPLSGPLVLGFDGSPGSRIAAKVEDVIGLYVDPPQHAVVLSIDEKSQIQALDRTQPGLPMKRGRLGTMTHDYKRNGTTTLFAAVELLQGKVVGQCYARHRHQEFLKFLKARK